MKPRLIAVLVFLCAFGLYLHGSYPSVSVGDSGEFIAAGAMLGIPHAPGYPTYILLSKCVQSLVPWGNRGYRANLFSALCGAAAVAMLFGMVCAFSGHMGIGLCTAFIFMLGRAQLVNAQASEVFALHTLFCAGVLWAGLSKRWLLAAFLTGGGMGNHQTLLFLAPALAAAYLARPAAERPPVLLLAAAALAGLSLYAVLYVRAAKAPILNSGDPETLEKLWRVFTRADYGSLTLALGETPARTVGFTLRQLERFVHGLSDQVTWVGIGLGFVGIAAAYKKRSTWGFMVLIGFLLLGPGFFVLGNLPFDAQSKGLLERFYIVPVFCWVLLMALGIQWLAQRHRAFVWAAFAVPLFLGLQQARANSSRNDFSAYGYGRNNLRTLAPHSLFIMDGGDDTFYSLAYMTGVERRRPDVRLHDRGGVVFPGLYGADFRKLTREEKDERRQQVEQALLRGESPVYFSTMNDKLLKQGRLVQYGLLYRAALVDHPESADTWAFYDLRGIAPWAASSLRVSPDYRTRALLPFYAYQRSAQAARAGAWEEARRFASSARAQGPDALWLSPNLLHNAYLWAETNFQAGRLDLAESFYRVVLGWVPNESTAWSNLGALEEKRGRLDAAVANYQKALEIDPASESAHFNLAVVYWKRQEWPKVMDELKRVLAINPDHVAARAYLSQVEARLRSSR